MTRRGILGTSETIWTITVRILGLVKQRLVFIVGGEPGRSMSRNNHWKVCVVTLCVLHVSVWASGGWDGSTGQWGIYGKKKKNGPSFVIYCIFGLEMVYVCDWPTQINTQG